jgi:hypothetical protein
MSYILVNPNIESIPIKSKMKSSDDVAKDLWKKFSSKIKNYTPNFYFSFMELGSSKIHHYQVNEDLKNNKVKYSLKKYKKINTNILGKKGLPVPELSYNKSGVKDINNDQLGGIQKKRYKKDDSSSSSEDNSSSSSGDDLLLSYQLKQNYNLPISIKYNPNIYGANNMVLPPISSRYSYIIDTDGLPTIYSPHPSGISVHKFASNKWDLHSIIPK